MKYVPYTPSAEDDAHDRSQQELADIGIVRFSHLRAYGRSAAHGHHARQKDQKQTYAMQRGTAVHAMLFGTRKVCGYPGSQRRGKEYDAFVAERPDTEILTMSEYDKALFMAESVMSNKLARQYLTGEREKTINFRWMGIDCRATPDVRGTNFLTELKSSSTAEPMRFTWHALRMAYHAQMRMQQIACGAPKLDCFVVCVESAEPYPVTVLQLDERTLEIGERMLVLWMERLKNCELSGYFPGYTEAVFPLIAPEDVNIELGDAE